MENFRKSPQTRWCWKNSSFKSVRKKFQPLKNFHLLIAKETIKMEILIVSAHLVPGNNATEAEQVVCITMNNI